MSEEHVLHCRREGVLAMQRSLPIATTGDILFGRTEYTISRNTGQCGRWNLILEPDTVQSVAVDTERERSA